MDLEVGQLNSSFNDKGQALWRTHWYQTSSAGQPNLTYAALTKGFGELLLYRQCLVFEKKELPLSSCRDTESQLSKILHCHLSRFELL